jgi:enolase-phosphatase E1
VIAFGGRGVLLDIEGTVAPITFVYDILFPYARRELADYLRRHWQETSMDSVRDQIARDAGASSWSSWLPDADDGDRREHLVAHLLRLMDQDAKTTGLKELQGRLWAEGYTAGRLCSEVFSDVAAALRRWAGQGLDVRIYSSGSVTAQQVYFAHTTAGDLRPALRGYYDTTTGPKRVSTSYVRIARDMDLPAGEVLFLSDVVAELDAAAEAGMRTGLVVRPLNAPVPGPLMHDTIHSLDEVELAREYRSP